jgi:hypothetical protein
MRTGYWFLVSDTDTGYWILDAGFWILVADKLGTLNSKL